MPEQVKRLSSSDASATLAYLEERSRFSGRSPPSPAAVAWLKALSPCRPQLSEETHVDNTKLLDTVRSMAFSTLRHYIVPGLTSQLIGIGPRGKVRLFESERNQRDFILPHSHRFAFTCLILQGAVTNIVYRRDPGNGELYAEGCLRMPEGGAPGDCVLTPGAHAVAYSEQRTRYTAGATYSMRPSEVHSVAFEAGAAVLFFEGPKESDTSIILEPWANGARVPTYGRTSWMFQEVE